MAVGKTVPWAEVLAYPLAATPVAVRHGFAITDVLKNMARPGRGEPPDRLYGDRWVGGVHLTTPALAMSTGQITDVSMLKWWKLEDPIAQSTVSGYTVEPYLCPRNNQIAGVWEVLGKTDDYCLEWVAVAGEYWLECIPDAEPRTVALSWTSSDRQLEYAAETWKPVPENQSWAMRLWWLGTGPLRGEEEEDSPYAEVGWGGGMWGLRFTALKPPQLGKYAKGEWQPVRTFDDADVDPFLLGEPMWLRVYHIAGRMVVELEPAGGKASHLVYTEKPTGPYGASDIRPVRTPEGVISLRGRGIPFKAQLHEVKWGHWVEEEKDEYGLVTAAHFDGAGSFKREYTCTRNVSANATKAAAFGYYENGNPQRRQTFPEGDAGTVATVTDKPLVNPHGQHVGKRQYTCTLTAHNPAQQTERVSPSHVVGEYLGYTPNAMCGAVTPFVHSVSVRLGHTTAEETVAPIDIRPAIRRMTGDMADPALQAGPVWNILVDRSLLPDCEITGGGGPVGDNWVNYVQKYHRLVINLAWHYEDGTIAAQEEDGTPHAKAAKLDGFITEWNPEASGFGEYAGTITARDPSVLLQAPAGIVDGRFAPLDILLMEKLDAGERKLMGWEGVKQILEVALGPDWADSLAHKFSATHYDLLKHKILLDPPQAGFFFPPPFGRDAYQWIQELAERDFAIFFFAPEAADPTKLVPWYANYFEYLADAPEIELPDAVYVAGDVDEAMISAASRHEPRRDVNRILVWGAPPGQQSLGGVMPALPAFSAEARIEQSDFPEQAIENTWERTLVLSGSRFWLKFVARIVALSTARLIRNVDVRGITVKVRGRPWLWWGWKARPKMEAAASDDIGLDGQLCRIMRINDVIDFDKSRWETRLRLAPEPA